MHALAPRHLPRPAPRRRLDHDSGDRPLRICELLDTLVTSLGKTFSLTLHERELAYSILFGRDTAAIAQARNIDEATATAEIAAMFGRTQTDSRETLLRTGLRLASTHSHQAPTTPPPFPHVGMRRSARTR